MSWIWSLLLVLALWEVASKLDDISEEVEKFRREYERQKKLDRK